MEPRTALPRDSERRYATVLFADISGFTRMSEQLDPEEVTEIINRCFSTLSSIVERHGGHVDKYIGDCVMALFGLPAALEKAPQQAVNAAIEMRRQLALLVEERHVRVSVDLHIGINTGLMIAGHVGGEVKKEFTVMGDAVNLASRLKDMAPNGAIYLGAETHRYVREEFECRKLPALAVKGKERPVDAYELLSVRERVHRPKPAPSGGMVSSPLVGRDRELALLRACLAAVVRGEGGIVNLIGEAGLGKSRILAEACAAAEAEEATVLEGRSLSMGQRLRFHPFIDLLKHWAGIAEDEGEDATRAKLEAAVRTVVGDDAGEVFPFVATLMDVRLPGSHGERIAGIQGESMEKLIVKSVRELFRRMAAARPLVLVFEDLHWADLSSIRLLEALLRLVPGERILFLHVFRPDHRETSDRILQVSREQHTDHQIEIQLESLGDRQCHALIRNLFKSDQLPHAVLTHIARTAEGNPFYLEEVVRSLVDEGVVEQLREAPGLTERVHSIVIPDTIQGVVMARVDRLPEDARQLLQIASVLGRSFPHRLLGGIVPPEIDLDAELAQLKERQLLLERRTRRTASARRVTLGEEAEWVFKHALVQETVYNSILQRTRKELHLKVAEAIEERFAERLPDFYGMLAYHYSRAESPAKAEQYLLEAGAQAARAAASTEALAFFREASRLYLAMHGERADPRKRALLEKNIALALLTKGELTESIEHFDQALALLGVQPPRTPLRRTLRWAVDLAAVLYHVYVRGLAEGTVKDLEYEREVVELYFHRGRAEVTSDPRRLFFELPTGLRRFDRIDPKQIEQACAMYVSCAGLFAYSGLSFTLSRRMLDVARTLVREGNPVDAFVHRSAEYYLHYFIGDWDDGITIDEALVEENLRFGQLWEVNTYLGIECDRRLHRGDFDAARALLARLGELLTVYGYGFAEPNRDIMNALVLLEVRAVREALHEAERYEQMRHEDALRVLGLGTVAKAAILLGERDRAAAALSRAGGILAASGQVSPWHQSGYLVARLLHDVSGLAAAEDRASRRALARAARRSARRALRVGKCVAKDRVETYRLVGTLSWLLGGRQRAIGWWDRSLTEGRRLGARPEVARTHLEVGRRLHEGGDASTLAAGLAADGHLEQARTLFAELGLTGELAELDGDAPAVGRSSSSPRG